MEYHDHQQISLPQEKIFSVISDVENYQYFLPWCYGSRITKQTSEHHIVVELLIGFQHLREKFTSEVSIMPDIGRVEMRGCLAEKIHGNQVIKQLDSYWQLTVLAANQTDIQLCINFTMKSALYNQMVKLMMKQMSKHMADAFISRAYQEATK